MKGEFDFIHRLKSRFNLGRIGDDCAVLPKDNDTDQVITADMLIEDIDFRLEWTTPEFLGHKALAVSLSDIAAMGAAPKWAMLSIGIPERLWKTDFLDLFYDGLHSLADQHSVELIGGDISRIEDKLVIDSIVLGEVATGRAVLRSGAKAGDLIFVSGYVGGAAAGLKLLENGERIAESMPVPLGHLLFRQLQPLPQVRTAKLLQEYHLPTAMIDISDGLSSDLGHLCEASGVGAVIESDLIPVDPAISAVMTSSLDLALHGGEDFELLFTTDQKNISVAQDLGFHMIGEITANAGIIELNASGKHSILEPKGYRHF